MTVYVNIFIKNNLGSRLNENGKSFYYGRTYFSIKR